MKNCKAALVAVLGLLLLISTSACGDDDSGTTSNAGADNQAAVGSSCEGAISWEQAKANVGKKTTVRGPVVGTNYATSSKGQPTFLDVGKPYPDAARFTVLIWGSDRSKFQGAPEQTYRGKTICVSGLIQSYRGAAEIEVKSPADIVVQ